MQRFDALRIVGPYGAAHALVDASCAALVFSATASGRIPIATAAAAVLAYNLLAFASQPLLGWFLTNEDTAREWARFGASLTAFAFLLSVISAAFWPAVVMAGLGNAIFHLGGGVISLRLEPGMATLPGIFVAPGAAGLAIGVWMGTNQFVVWLPAVLLVLSVPLLRKAGMLAEERPHSGGSQASRIPVLAICTVFAVIVLRSFIGSGIVLPWKSEPALFWLLIAAVVAGKAAGGVLADRFGHARVGVGALVVSAPLLLAGPSWAVTGIVGMLLFNMTMPVTLVALADRLPGRPGFAFGLTCLALIAGGLPLTFKLVGSMNAVSVGVLVLGSAALLWVGLLQPRSVLAPSVSLTARSQEAS